MNETLDAEVVQPSLALTKPEPQPITPAPKAELTPAQARVESVADVLAKARAQASQLRLSPEEIKVLKAEFPDEAFKMGAGGDPNLIYIEHAFLRDRFDEALGMCQWALIRSRPHWAEEYTTSNNKKAVRIYADCALVIRGCLVSEAIGEMTYFPNNAQQSYGDAAEGSETAAFRRCAKKIGVGLQAWKKDFGEGWKHRQRTGQRPPPSMPTQAGKVAPAPSQGPNDGVSVPVVFNERKFREEAEVWLKKERDQWVKANTTIAAWVYAVANGMILQTEQLSAITWSKLFQLSDALEAAIKTVRTGQPEAGAKRKLSVQLIERKEALTKAISEVGIGDVERAAFEAAYGPPGASTEDAGPPPRLPIGSGTDAPAIVDWFWEVICPIPHRGQKKADYENNPDTIGSLYDAAKDGNEDARKRLYGFANNWKPEPRTVGGKTYQPSAADLKFREALDAFLEHQEQKGNEGAEAMRQGVDDDSDEPPF